MRSNIAAQLYTLRDYLTTPADIAKTLPRVKRLGYDAIQASGMGQIDAKELAKILRDSGLTCCATHIAIDRLKNEQEKVLEDHALWDCKYTAIGGFFQNSYTTQDWHTFTDTYNQIARKYANSGLHIGYHNHSHELAKFDRQPALQILIDKLDPSIWMEIDTYWIAHGGGDPAAWIKKVSGRIPCVHLKDMGVKTDRTQFMAEVGEGNLNWPAILQACRDAGVQWYIVEQDTCYRDPFESLGISLQNLQQMGI